MKPELDHPTAAARRERERADTGITLVREGESRLAVRGSKFEEVMAFLRWNVARVVAAHALVGQVVDGVMDAVVMAAATRADFVRITSRWVQTTARRVSFGRRHRGRLLLPLDFDPVVSDRRSSEVRVDATLRTAIEVAISRLGRKSRIAMTTLLSTGNLDLAMDASGMSESNVFRARRRLRDLAREILDEMTVERHECPVGHCLELSRE
jgi:hypothetical protein